MEGIAGLKKWCRTDANFQKLQPFQALNRYPPVIIGILFFLFFLLFQLQLVSLCAIVLPLDTMGIAIAVPGYKLAAMYGRQLPHWVPHSAASSGCS